MSILLLVTLLVLSASFSEASSEVKQVHIIAHSHDDPGWLKTVDQYYSGTNNTIYLASVQYIFDSVITELKKDETRKYSMCEISFLSRWWYEQNDETKETVRELIKSKRLAVLNGGWVMHDEASAHYVSMIDQTTLGHTFLKNELGYTPKVGWQIDPFGHSNTHAWMSSEFGFDALYFGRIDYQDHEKRMAEKTMEMIWKGSNSQQNAEVFTGVFSSGNYGAPPGLCFDRSCQYCRDDPVTEDPLLETYNLESKAKILVEAIEKEIQHSVGNNIKVLMGADFVMDNSNSWFKSIDILMKHINKVHGDRFNLFYSTPDLYTEARAKESLEWTVKTDDFFPYADCAHCYWSGYFTSRPTIKFAERKASSLLQVLRHSLVTNSAISSNEGKNADLQLTAAVGLVNHHDAITGTSKQHVADDYVKILSKAMDSAESMISKQVKSSDGNIYQWNMCRYANESSCALTQGVTDGAIDVIVYNPLPRSQCQSVSLYLNQPHVQVKKVKSDGSFDSVSAAIIPTFVTKNTPNPGKQSKYTLVFTAHMIKPLESNQYRIIVQSTPPADESFSSGYAEIASSIAVSTEANRIKPLIVETRSLSLLFSSDGRLGSISRKDAETGLVVAQTQLKQTLGYYVSFGSPGVKGFKHPIPDNRDPHEKNLKPHELYAKADSSSTQASGAYLFRPQHDNDDPISVNNDQIVDINVVKSEQVTEIRQTFNEWTSQIIRISDESPLVEFEWTVGPIPVESDNLGKEVISKFTSGLKTDSIGSEAKGNEFYTDANGREFQQRIYNYRPTWNLRAHENIAGNYYPITTSMYLKDDAAKVQLSILTDRSQAAASLKNGEMEFMVHRRLVADDQRGVEEPLNETTKGFLGEYPTWSRQGNGIIIRGKHFVLLSELSNGMKEVRQYMDKLYALNNNVLVKRGDAKGLGLPVAHSLGEGLGISLPLNVQLMTLQLVNNNKQLLFRLAHQFANGEDSLLSQDVMVDLSQLLAKFKVSKDSLTELNLSTNQLQSDMVKHKINWKEVAGAVSKGRGSTEQSSKDSGMTIGLSPMQIRTFTVDLI